MMTMPHLPRSVSALAALALSLALLPAQEKGTSASAPTPAAPAPKVTKIGETEYRLGEIVFDAKSREIRLPAAMNLREGGPIEYFLVHESGKVHEGMLTTKVKPLDLQIVMKLLRYKSGEGDLFDTFLPAEEQRRKIEAGAKTERGDAIAVKVAWEKDGAKHEHSAAEWILDGENSQPMPDAPWILTGSHMANGAYLADAEGSLIAIYLDQIAMLNMNRKGAENDERWGANAAKTPDVGQKITVLLRPAK
jgi:hypothetical protein